MLQLFRTSLVFRTTVSVVLVVLLVGVFFTVVALSLLNDRERLQTAAHLDELLKTVESTVSISCFLQDKNLASEVSRGLMKNRVVKSVIIVEEGTVLAQEGRPSGTSGLRRTITSPFDASKPICQIVMEPNEAVIEEQVSRSSRLIVYLLLMQAAAVGLTVVIGVWKWVIEPIKTISDQLHRLPVEAGARLQLSRKYAKDEIARMVGDVNALITSLVKTLHQERELRIWREREEKRFRTIFENAETGIFVIDKNGYIFSYNPAFVRTLGIQEGDLSDRTKTSLPVLLGMSMESGNAIIARSLTENRVVAEDVRIDSGGREPRWISLVLNPVEEGMLQGLINDISERKKSEESANRLAMTDRLTGIANRLAFETKLADLAERAALDSGEPYILMLMDLDGFKQVNDTHGHDAGDAVLRHFAGLLESTVRKSDFIGRLGGDEFVILLESPIPREGVERIAQKIIASLAAPIRIGRDVEAKVGASIGIAFSREAADKDAVFKLADEAMYRAKRAGKNTYRMHPEDADADAIVGSE
ncbi:sensor domain-containing diguanylate cyclase [Noviherbaspirillum saxi]|nr:sensor domain-containing diguanylate cyclase [Noviherbaspirillum saxi]